MVDTDTMMILWVCEEHYIASFDVRLCNVYVGYWIDVYLGLSMSSVCIAMADV